jgi:hypothetical protein
MHEHSLYSALPEQWWPPEQEHLREQAGCWPPVACLGYNLWCLVWRVQSGEDWEAVQSGKARGALNLDAACSGVTTLEHFVVFSSVVAAVGNEGGTRMTVLTSCMCAGLCRLQCAGAGGALKGLLRMHAPAQCAGACSILKGLLRVRAPGQCAGGAGGALKVFCCACVRAGQANYGAANSVCNTLCLQRRAAGLPALALQWGAVGGVGYVAETMKVRTADSLLLSSVACSGAPAHACFGTHGACL